MNSLYTLGVRQTNSIQADLERLRTGDANASLLGLSMIPTSLLTSLSTSTVPVRCFGRPARFVNEMCIRQLTAQPFLLSLVRADFRLASSYEQNGGRLRLDG